MGYRFLKRFRIWRGKTLLWLLRLEGRLAKFYEESCLMDQPFIKDNSLTIDQMVKEAIARLQENISIARFARFKVGDRTGAPAEQPAAE